MSRRASEDDSVPEECLAHLRSEARTWFVLDLLKEQSDQLRLAKKEELIKKLAQQQKMHVSSIPLPPNRSPVSLNTKEQMAERRAKVENAEQEEMSEAAKEATRDMGVTIMGMIRDQRIEQAHRDHGVLDEPVRSPNDMAIREKFDKP